MPSSWKNCSERSSAPSTGRGGKGQGEEAIVSMGMTEEKGVKDEVVREVDLRFRVGGGVPRWRSVCELRDREMR